MGKVHVLQRPNAEIPVEVLATSIKEIAEGMKVFNKANLNRRALLVLLRDATALPMSDINKVLESLEQLDQLFLKQKKGK